MRRDGERGIALPLVLAVLVCLLALAIPFAISMKHEQSTATSRIHRVEARVEAEMLQQFVAAKARQGLPDQDETPYWDTLDEVRPDLDAIAADLGLTLSARERLWSMSVRDHGARIDLNAAPLHVIARGLGLSSRLSREVASEDDELRVEDGDVFGQSGYVWVAGEVMRFTGRDRSRLTGLGRPTSVRGVWEPMDLSERGPRNHQVGTEVIDFRAYLVLHRLFAGGVEGGYSRIEEAHAIAEHPDVGVLETRHRQALERWFTTRSQDGGRMRWVDPQRVIGQVIGGQTRRLVIANGQYYGYGTLLRLTSRQGAEAFVVSLGGQAQANGTWTLNLEMPPTFSADAYECLVESQFRRPLNVNTCEPELLARLLQDLPSPTSDVAVSERLARSVADAFVAARPLQGLRSVDAVLDVMVEDQLLTTAQRNVLYANAHHAGDRSAGQGTLPFSFTLPNVFDVDTGASLNYRLSGREKSRAFLSETFATSGDGEAFQDFVTQRDFEEPFRLTRRAKHWTTYPENLQLAHPSELYNDPPGRTISENVLRLDRFASEEVVDVAAGLAPARMLGFVGGTNGENGMPGLVDVTFHYDSAFDASGHPDGWLLGEATPPTFPTDGGSWGGSDRATSIGDARPDMVQIVSSPTGQSFLRPFGVSMWWNPGASLSQHTLFDVGTEDSRNRVVLEFDGQALTFRVMGSEWPPDWMDSERIGGVIQYAFEGNPPLEADTWYHVTAYCRGTKASQMSLWVDHRPRGTRHYFSRVTGGTSAGQPTSANGTADAPIVLEDASTFPQQRGVVKIGGEILEYTSRSGNSLVFQPDGEDPLFGGRAARGSAAVVDTLRTHPDGASAELYGYSVPTAMPELPTGAEGLLDGVHSFYVARLDPTSSELVSIDVNVPTIGSFPIGEGFEGDAQELPVVPLSLQGDIPEGVFQANGGYAALVSHQFQDETYQIQRQTITLRETVNGSTFHGLELISYGSYSNGMLGQVARVAALPEREPANWAQFPDYLRPKAFLMKTTQLPGFDQWDSIPVMVIPLSLPLRDPSKFPIPAAPGLSELIQIDSDYASEDEGSLEWFRYDSVDTGLGFVVRDHPNVLMRTQRGIDGGQNGQNSLLQELGTNAGAYGDSTRNFEDLLAQLNWDPSIPEELRKVEGDFQGPGLAFRGCLGTYDCKHTSGAPIRPVWRVLRTGRPQDQVRPGRHDWVTLVDPQGATSSTPFRITYAYPRNVQNFTGTNHGPTTHVAFEQKIDRTWPWTIDLSVGGTTLSGHTGTVYTGEVRGHMRMVKFPSGELAGSTPAPSRLLIGQDSQGQGGGATAIIDEVRIFSDPAPHAELPCAMHRLALELEATEDDVCDVDEWGWWWPHGAPWVNQGPQGVLNHIPEDACVVQIGDEIMLVDTIERADSDRNFEFAENGRGAFQTEPAYHHAGSPFMVLPWFVVTPLTRGLGPDQPDIELENVRGFPPSGYVQIDQEILGYSYNLAGGLTSGPGTLRVPTYFFLQGQGSSQQSAAFRGRFGSTPTSHDTDSLVFWFPHRYADSWVDRADFPEMAAYELRVDARRAWFESLEWTEESGGGGSNLLALARVQGRGRFWGDPEDDPALFLFDQPSDDQQGHPLGRQGDQLVIRFYNQYRQGAIEPDQMTSNAWKQRSKLTGVVVKYRGQRTVESHRESR